MKKKDEHGNTYRDVENTAYLKYLAEDFTKETGINVELHVVTNEEELRPFFQVKDDIVDVYTCPNWSLEEWKAYAEPYCTLEEGIEQYGEYAKAMPQVDGYIYSIMPGRAYNQAVVYNEEVIKAAGYDEIPATLEEFNNMCEKIKSMGITPFHCTGLRTGRWRPCRILPYMSQVTRMYSLNASRPKIPSLKPPRSEKQLKCTQNGKQEASLNPKYIPISALPWTVLLTEEPL